MKFFIMFFVWNVNECVRQNAREKVSSGMIVDKMYTMRRTKFGYNGFGHITYYCITKEFVYDD